jgi:hypothetical protein
VQAVGEKLEEEKVFLFMKRTGGALWEDKYQLLKIDSWTEWRNSPRPVDFGGNGGGHSLIGVSVALLYFMEGVEAGEERERFWLFKLQGSLHISPGWEVGDSHPSRGRTTASTTTHTIRHDFYNPIDCLYTWHNWAFYRWGKSFQARLRDRAYSCTSPLSHWPHTALNSLTYTLIQLIYKTSCFLGMIFFFQTYSRV